MPLDNPALRGSEKDSSQSNLYCKYCYQDGAFTDTGLTIEKMQEKIIFRMQSEKIPAKSIDAAKQRLPHLLRWKKKKAIPATEVPVSLQPASPEKQPLQEPPPPGPLAETEGELDCISGEEQDLITPEELEGN